jgi:hypothetical protein
MNAYLSVLKIVVETIGSTDVLRAKTRIGVRIATRHRMMTIAMIDPISIFFRLVYGWLLDELTWQSHANSR